MLILKWLSHVVLVLLLLTKIFYDYFKSADWKLKVLFLITPNSLLSKMNAMSDAFQSVMRSSA